MKKLIDLGNLTLTHVVELCSKTNLMSLSMIIFVCFKHNTIAYFSKWMEKTHVMVLF